MKLKNNERLTETQLVQKIRGRYKLSFGEARILARNTQKHLRYMRAWSSNADVWARLLSDELIGGDTAELLKENEVKESAGSQGD